MPPTWIFDLDNTLHDARPHIFPHIHRSMQAYMMRHFALSDAEAEALRVRYWRAYGATLVGVIKHHAVDPHHFLWHTHQFPNLARMLIAEPGLATSIRRLRGRKIVFSNGPKHYALATLHVLGIARLFDAVYGIEDVGFAPKPAVSAFRTILARESLTAARCVMIEDSSANLRSAKRLGMRTVWISPEARQPRHVDRRIRRIAELIRSA